MSARDWAWTTAGAAGMFSVLLGALAVWLLLTDPLPMVAAASRHDAIALVHTVARAVYDVAVQLLRWV